MDLEQFEKIIKYSFQKKDLLQQALTHKSFGSPHYERLEFLGDSLLNTWVSIWLMRLFPHLSEGRLSLMRASIISRKTLAELGNKWNAMTYCRQSLPKSHQKNAKSGIAADCVESVTAAVYLDSDWQTCGQFLWCWFEKMCHNAHHAKLHDKTALQQWCQKRSLSLPEYSSKPLAQGFEVVCAIEGISHKVKEHGSSKREAELLAAKGMRLWLEKHKC